jgi:hypothetical protein
MEYINEHGRKATVSDDEAREILTRLLAARPEIQGELEGHTGPALGMRQRQLVCAEIERHRRAQN